MNIGDTISVVDDNLSGILTAIHRNTVIFEDEYGFSHEVPVDKVVPKNAALYQQVPVVPKAEPRKNVSKKHDKNPLVLDLHFQNLVSNPHDYDAFERLFIQKERLLEMLRFCRKNNLKKLEIIHGIGDGTLQKMVYETLEGQTKLDFYNKEILHHQSGAILVDFH